MSPEDEKIKERVKNIKHKILILSGKGGVGKSTVAVNLAAILSLAGKKVGLLDIDIHGPSIPKLLGADGTPLRVAANSMQPVTIWKNLSVMSIGFLLRSNDDAVIWRGPMKYNMIKQFLSEVEWGKLDYLIIDSPPGTGDEPLTIAQLVRDADGAVVVTTPQDIALMDVRKCISFCRQVSLPVIGVIENMSGFVCPNCGERTDIFKCGGGEELARDMGVPFLGRIPIDPAIVSASDEGRPYVVDFLQTETGRIFNAAIAPILGFEEGPQTKGETVMRNPDKRFKIAIPVTGGKLSMHFGHCESFAIFDIDGDEKKIIGKELIEAPPHQPGLLPSWLRDRGAELVIAGGMGQRAQELFRENGVEVIVGAPPEEPESIAISYIEGKLVPGENVCDH